MNMTLSAGTFLGPYEILSPIGAGGMGEVYKAKDTRLGRTVAIKRLKGPHSDRFQREAEAIGALNHPHICTLYDIGPDYLVMEYIEGSPVCGPLPPDETVRVALQIADALECAHGKGIIHRDLKPANILLTSKGVKLLDFGLAKLVQVSEQSDSTVTETQAGTIVGTAAYMSPEQCQGLPVDPRSDIFSFGAVLYELLSGRRAFIGQNSISVIAEILHKEPKRFELPSGLAGIITRCLRKSAADRFQTMAELRAALGAASHASEPLPSIAVLPFANMSGDQDNEYFSDGLAEEIINELTRVRGIRVIARTSAFAFKGKHEDIRKIAEALGVTNILEGSVRRAGSRVRVTAQLISAVDGSHVWSERYDRELADVFAVQDEMAHAIATALHVKLGTGSGMPRRYTPNLPAYEAFLRARHYWRKFSPEALSRCREYLEQAIALDPQFALAHSLLGECFLHFAHFSTMSAQEAVPVIRVCAQKALELDSSVSEAHAMLGVVAGLYDHDWEEAERRFRLAMAQEPVSLDVRMWYAHSFLLSVGRAVEAVRELEGVKHEDPVNAVFHHMFAMCLQRAGSEMEAGAEFRYVLDLEENTPAALIWLGHHYAWKGMMVEALTCLQRVNSLMPWNSEVIGGLAGLLMRTGNPDHAKELMQKLGDGAAYGAALGFIFFHLICGELEAAADWIGRAIEERHFLAAMYLWSPLAKPVRDGSRWPGLARMIGLQNICAVAAPGSSR